jgi:hypothetical protein
MHKEIEKKILIPLWKRKDLFSLSDQLGNCSHVFEPCRPLCKKGTVRENGLKTKLGLERKI